VSLPVVCVVRTQVLRVALIVCWELCGASGLAAQTPTGGATLTRVRALTIPSGMDVIGVVGSSDGHLAFWTAQSVHTILHDSIVDVTHSVDRPVAVAAVSGAWEVVDRGSGTIMRISNRAGALVTQTPLPTGIDPHAGARLECGWLFQLWDDQTADVHLALVDEAGELRWRRTAPWAKPGRPSRGPALHLASAGSRAVATLLDLPHTIATIDCAGTVRVLDAGPPLPAGGIWIGLSTLQVQHGYLTTYSDIGSDHRIIRRRDTRGHFVGDTSIDVPLGLWSTVGDRLMIGLMRTDRLELVVYEIADRN
jgi:hypothetical protein